MDFLALISSLFYLIATIQVSRYLFSADKQLPKVTFIPIILALLTHANWLYLHIFLILGNNLPILNVVSLVTFILSLLTTLVSKRLHTTILQPLVYSFSVITFIVAMHLPSHYITHLESHPYLGTHIILALISYSLLTIASLFALQLAYIDYRLKNRKSPLTTLKMPSLLTLEKTLFQFVLFGFSLLTLTLLTGFLFLDDMLTPIVAHKSILTMIAWVIYAVLLWGHYSKGWRGKLIIYITIAGSSLLTLAYFGSRFVREIILA
ncbi:MAG TPA: inner membrane protein YpjD [Psychromonas hadalis]|nr:inner membrane protein YpjD [Psychromonas hadalis]